MLSENILYKNMKTVNLKVESSVHVRMRIYNYSAISQLKQAS